MDKTTKSFPRSFFPPIALHSKNIWHQHVPHVHILFCSQMYWVLETHQFQFWAKFNKPFSDPQLSEWWSAVNQIFSHRHSQKEWRIQPFYKKFQIPIKTFVVFTSHTCLIYHYAGAVLMPRDTIWVVFKTTITSAVLFENVQRELNFKVFFLLLLLFFSWTENIIWAKKKEKKDFVRPKVFHCVLLEWKPARLQIAELQGRREERGEKSGRILQLINF